MMQALLDLVPCVLLSAQDTFRIAQQDIALRCAAQPLAGALKQRGSQLAFQIADGFGYGRLGYVQAPCGARHVFQLGDGGKLPELIEFQSIPSSQIQDIII